MRTPGAYTEPPENVRRITHEQVLVDAIIDAQRTGQPWATRLTRVEVNAIAAYLAEQVAFAKEKR